MAQQPLKNFDGPPMRISLSIRINFLFYLFFNQNTQLLDGTTVKNMSNN